MPTYVFKQTIGLNEIYPTYEAADIGGNTCDPGDRVFLHLKNDQPASVSASVTITIDDPNTVEPTGGTTFDPDVTISLGAQDDVMVGPLYSSRFANETTGYVNISYDDVDSIQIAVFDLSPPRI